MNSIFKPLFVFGGRHGSKIRRKNCLNRDEGDDCLNRNEDDKVDEDDEDDE